MSIQSEIDRLSNAKQYIAQAIGNKGVEVPSGVKLDALHSYISAIPVSGLEIGEKLGVYETSGGVIDATVTFGNRVFSGLVAVGGETVIVAAARPGHGVCTNDWISNVYSSSGGAPAAGWLTFEGTSAICHMTWVICPDGSMSDRSFTLYGLG